MSHWKSIFDNPPSSGCKFIALFNDGSGSTMYWRHDHGFIDCEGGEYTELSDHYSLWTELPDGITFWCENTSEEPMTLSQPPAHRGDAV